MESERHSTGSQTNHRYGVHHCLLTALGTVLPTEYIRGSSPSGLPAHRATEYVPVGEIESTRNQAVRNPNYGVPRRAKSPMDHGRRLRFLEQIRSTWAVPRILPWRNRPSLVANHRLCMFCNRWFRLLQIPHSLRVWVGFRDFRSFRLSGLRSYRVSGAF